MLPQAALALSTDREQPAFIEADKVDIDDQKHIAIYQGQVKYTQGSMRLWADKVTIYTDEENELKEVIAVGRPARYRQRPDGKDQDVWGEGIKLHYFATTEKLHLLKKGKLWQEGNTFTSDRIIYDIKHDLLVAGQRGDNRKRVRMMLMPKKKSTPQPAQSAPATNAPALELDLLNTGRGKKDTRTGAAKTTP